MNINSEFPYNFMNEAESQFGDLPFTEWNEDPKPTKPGDDDILSETEVSEG